MIYKSLGNSTQKISQLGFGCEPLGGTDWGDFSEAKVVQAVREAMERGINLFDTADIYGLGRSEKMLSYALGEKRKDIVIITKFGVNWRLKKGEKRARTHYDSSPERVRKALHDSLKRLRVESIPIYMIHWPDPQTHIEVTMNELIKAKNDGKIQHIGVSNFSEAQIKQAHSIEPLSCVEIPYNLIHRQVGMDIFSICEESKISILAYGPLAQGYLTGKYKNGVKFQTNDRRSILDHFKDKAMKSNHKVLIRLKELSEKYKCTPSNIALKWVLDSQSITSVIVGGKTVNQVKDNLNISNLQLDNDDIISLTNIIN